MQLTAIPVHDWLMTYIGIDPTMGPLRDDPRFQDLLRRLPTAGRPELPGKLGHLFLHTIITNKSLCDGTFLIWLGHNPMINHIEMYQLQKGTMGLITLRNNFYLVGASGY